MVARAQSNPFLWPLITSLLGVLLLFTEEFGAWQNRDPFYGVTEGYVWIGSMKAAPWAQIGVLLLSGGLIFCAYVAWNGYRDPNKVGGRMVGLAYKIALGVVGLTILFGLAFIALVYDSDWWWFGGGFYGSLVGGALTAFLFRRIHQT